MIMKLTNNDHIYTAKHVLLFLNRFWLVIMNSLVTQYHVISEGEQRKQEVSIYFFSFLASISLGTFALKAGSKVLKVPITPKYFFA